MGLVHRASWGQQVSAGGWPIDLPWTRSPGAQGLWSALLAAETQPGVLTGAGHAGPSPRSSVSVLISLSSGMPNHSASIQVCHGTRGSPPRPQGHRLCHWFRRRDQWHLPSLQLCVQKLRILIEDSDQNCELLPLQALRPRPPPVRARPRPRGAWAWHGWQIPPWARPPRLHGRFLPASISGCGLAVSTGKVFKLWAPCPHPRGAGTRLQGGAGEAGRSAVET